MFGFFDRSTEKTSTSSSWLSLLYRGTHLVTGGIVVYGMASDPEQFSPEFTLDALLHFAEALTPGQFNDLLLGLNIGRMMQASAKAECGTNAQIESTDVLLHLTAVISRTPQFIRDRLNGLTSYWHGNTDSVNTDHATTHSIR